MTFEDLASIHSAAHSFLCNAYSLNNTVSEVGVALRYNSHISGWDPDVKGSGTPVIWGHLYLKSPNKTKPGMTVNADNELEQNMVHPLWTKQNTLRVCLQYWDANVTNTKGEYHFEQLRWVLNWTYPNQHANFTPQYSVVRSKKNLTNVRDWCAQGAFADNILQKNGRTRGYNQKVDDAKKAGYKSIKGGRRLLPVTENEKQNSNRPLEAEEG